MEYEKTTEEGKVEKWHVDEATGVPAKVVILRLLSVI